MHNLGLKTNIGRGAYFLNRMSPQVTIHRQIVLQSKSQATLTTLRFKCFALGSWITKHAGKTTLNISAIGEKRIWLDGLFDIVRQKNQPLEFSNA
jgi:hypothetical protein